MTEEEKRRWAGLIVVVTGLTIVVAGLRDRLGVGAHDDGFAGTLETAKRWIADVQSDIPPDTVTTDRPEGS